MRTWYRAKGMHPGPHSKTMGSQGAPLWYQIHQGQIVASVGSNHPAWVRSSEYYTEAELDERLIPVAAFGETTHIDDAMDIGL